MRREGVDAPQVRCDKCYRWAYLDETGYKTLREARSASDFVCTLCVSDAASAAKLEAVEAETTALRGMIVLLREQLGKVTAQLGLNANPSSVGNDTAYEEMSRHELRMSQPQELGPDMAHAESDAARDSGDDAAPVSAAPMSLGNSAQSVSTGEKRAGLEQTPVDTPEKERLVGQGTVSSDKTMTNDNLASPGNSRKDHPDRDENRDAKVPPQGTQSLNVGFREGVVRRNKALPTLKEKGSVRVATQSEDAPGHNTQRKRLNTRRNSQPSKQDKETSRQGSNWVYPAWNAAKEVIIVGDANVGKFGAEVQKAIDAPGAVGLLYGKKATTATAMRYVNNYERKAKPIQRRYVLHVGLADVLRRTPDEILRCLEENWGDRPDDLIVCSIPDVITRGGETRAAILLANAKMKRWCNRTRHRFLDLGKGWEAGMIEKDGLKYSAEGAAFVAAKIVQATKPFLGKRSPLEHQQKPTEQIPKTEQVQLVPSGVDTTQTERGDNMPQPMQTQWPTPGPPPQQLSQAPIPTPIPTQVLLPWGPATAAMQPQLLHTPHQPLMLPTWGQAPAPLWNPHAALSSAVEELVRYHLMRAAHPPH